MTRAADARWHASAMIKSSMRFSFTGGHVGCTMKTSRPRTFSMISTLISPSLKRPDRDAAERQAQVITRCRARARGERCRRKSSSRWGPTARLLSAVVSLAGAVGIEPTYDGIKTRCLTAWLRPSLYCAGRVLLHSRRNCRGCQSSIVSCSASSPCVRSIRRGTSTCRIGRAGRRELVARIRDAPEPLVERRERAVVARLRVAASKPAIGKTEQPMRQARDRAATSRAAPRAPLRDPSASRVSPRAVTVNAFGGPLDLQHAVRRAGRARRARARRPSCRQLKLPWKARSPVSTASRPRISQDSTDSSCARRCS